MTSFLTHNRAFCCFAFATLFGTACAPRATARGQAEAAPVAPPCTSTGNAAGGVLGSEIIGTFALTLTATKGDRNGHSTSGGLTLEQTTGRFASDDGRTTYPAFGSARVALDSVGAVAPGSITSRAPDHPGVLAIKSAIGGMEPVLLLRFGDESNRQGDVRFDGAFMTLSVSSLSRSRISGTWTSGAGNRRASGFFCADRAL